MSEAIDAIKTHEDLIKVIAMLQKINVAAYWDWQVIAKTKKKFTTPSYTSYLVPS